MSYLTELREQVRLVIREVFLHDVCFEHTYCIRTNRDARVFLRHVVAYARRPEFDLNISLHQLACLIDSRRHWQFHQWFRRNIRKQVIFHRVRRFLNEMIHRNAVEDIETIRSLWTTAEDLQVTRSIEWPSAEQMNIWREIIDEIRKVSKADGPHIENLEEAKELLDTMQYYFLRMNSNGSLSSSSSDDDEASSQTGEDPSEIRSTLPENVESDISNALLECAVDINAEKGSGKVANLNQADPDPLTQACAVSSHSR